MIKVKTERSPFKFPPNLYFNQIFNQQVPSVNVTKKKYEPSVCNLYKRQKNNIFH